MPNDPSEWTRKPARFGGLVLQVAATLFFSLPIAVPLSAHGQAAAGMVAAAHGPADSALPDAPVPAADGWSMPQSSGRGGGVPARTHATTHFDPLIDPTEIAPKLTSYDKALMGLRRAVSPYAIIGWVGSASYEQAFDRSPNYGQTGKGYAQRLGAAAARASSEGIFTFALYAPVFHSDPRYYVLGPGHGFVHRAAYAVTRVLVTKKDSGAQTVNFALLAGNLTGAAVTQTYYPPGNRNAGQVASTFGTSLAGSAFGYLFDEFIVNSAEFLQLKHKTESKL